MTKSKHPLFKMWCRLRNYYTNPNNSHYKYYGGRGLEMSSEWMNNFYQFAHDIEALGPRPPDGILDRRDNDQGHNASNCFWGNPHDNCNNRQTSMMVTYQGRTQSLADWSTELGIKHRTLWSRLKPRQGLSAYSVDEAFTKPINRHYNK